METETSPSSRFGLRQMGIVALAIIAIGTAGHLLRTSLGLSSLADVQGAVDRLGWLGPVVFLGVLIFRQFLAVPAGLILPVGGLCFGAVGGTFLGAIGLIVSGMGKFAVARMVGREYVRAHFGVQLQWFEQRIERLGPLVIGISTAHPFGILSPFHWAAGLTSLSFASFAVALVLGAPVRAFAYAVFGSTLADTGSDSFILASVALAAIILVPLAIPSVRRRLFARI
ncbi:MAG TPA: VTT domain-containing protein [Candidatus Binatia bacterium]|nr:VTT domain-containing protein [Candidatus Binatia bacterium]